MCVFCDAFLSTCIPAAFLYRTNRDGNVIIFIKGVSPPCIVMLPGAYVYSYLLGLLDAAAVSAVLITGPINARATTAVLVPTTKSTKSFNSS